ncbi:hypothetical protein [Pseudomonas fluorescens]|uniref:Uncharacterized protein n=1 Tax=Pseudomonas fluorescens TaxID=294 RepID=A0A5E7A2F2_PSEFL|nr:hypothetical protein [Pseudomonas fluorescens]VVN72926.1 hypothetical protein PS710_00553 [Pseudomonas fluorescens]
MEKLVELLLGKVWPTLSATAKDVQVLFQSNTSFLGLMKTRSDICARAWLFGVVVAIGLVVLGLPALRSAGVKPSVELVGVMTLMNWFLIAIYGVCFGIAARLLRTSRPMMVSVNTFFFLSAWLVVLKLFEMPALGARFTAIAQSCTVDGYEAAVHAAIRGNQMAYNSDWFVVAGYMGFAYLIARMQTTLHDFGWMRAMVATTLGMMFLGVVAGYVQGPIISQLICSYGRDL